MFEFRSDSLRSVPPSRYPFCSSGVLPPTNDHYGSIRRDDSVLQDIVRRTLRHMLNIIVHGDIGEH